MSVKRCREEIDAEEFQSWKEYWLQNPEHEERADRRNGILCHLLTILKKDLVPVQYEPIDFMPYSKKPEIDMEAKREKVAKMMVAWAKGHNALVDAKMR